MHLRGNYSHSMWGWEVQSSQTQALKVAFVAQALSHDSNNRDFSLQGGLDSLRDMSCEQSLFLCDHSSLSLWRYFFKMNISWNTHLPFMILLLRSSNPGIWTFKNTLGNVDLDGPEILFWGAGRGWETVLYLDVSFWPYPQNAFTSLKKKGGKYGGRMYLGKTPVAMVEELFDKNSTRNDDFSLPIQLEMDSTCEEGRTSLLLSLFC